MQFGQWIAHDLILTPLATGTLTMYLPSMNTIQRWMGLLCFWPSLLSQSILSLSFSFPTPFTFRVSPGQKQRRSGWIANLQVQPAPRSTVRSASRPISRRTAPRLRFRQLSTDRHCVAIALLLCWIHSHSFLKLRGQIALSLVSCCIFAVCGKVVFWKILLQVPADDAYFPTVTAQGTKACIRQTRAINGQTGVGPRQQINQVRYMIYSCWHYVTNWNIWYGRK